MGEPSTRTRCRWPDPAASAPAIRRARIGSCGGPTGKPSIKLREARDAFHGAPKQNFVGAARIGVTEAFGYRHAAEMADDECGTETVAGAGRVNLLRSECRAMNCPTLVVVGGPLRGALDHHRTDAATEKRRYCSWLVGLGGEEAKLRPARHNNVGNEKYLFGEG